MSDAHPLSGSGVILGSLLVAATLDVMPWPEMLVWFRPQWLVLTMIYWTLALPQRVGVFWGLLAGLLQDTLLNSPFGQHALALVLTCYLTLLVHKRLERLGALPQSLVVFLLVGVNLWVSYVVQDAIGRVWLGPWVMLLLALASALVWQPVRLLLRLVQQQFLVR